MPGFCFHTDHTNHFHTNSHRSIFQGWLFVKTRFFQLEVLVDQGDHGGQPDDAETAEVYVTY